MTRPDAILEPDRLAWYRSLMSDDERRRGDRFHFARHRHAFAVTRATVRTLLSQYHHTPPETWRFETNQHGRPRIASEFATDLEFNISHTDGLIACAITRAREVGIDVEWSGRRGKTLEVADRFFAPAEVDALRSLPVAEQRQRFFVYWTLKESYIKARGMGLAIPLDQFAFTLPRNGQHEDRESQGRSIRISIDPRQGDDEASWRFWQWTLGPDSEHHAALSVRCGANESVRWTTRDWLP